MPTLRLDADAKAGVRALKDLDNAVGEIQKGMDETAISARKLEAAAARIVRENETPLERYNRKVKETGILLEKEKLTREQAERAVAKYRRELENAGKSQKKFSDESEKAAKALKAQGDAIRQSVETPFERHKRQLLDIGRLYRAGAIDKETFIRKSRELKQQLESTNGQLDRAGKSGQGVWGQHALSGVTSLVAGYASVAGAVGLISQALRQVEQENQRVADSFLQGMGAIGELQQVSATPEEYVANLAYGRSLLRRGIVSDVGSAMDISFATDAAGYSASDREFLARVGERKQVAPDKLIGFAQNLGKVRDLYGPGTSLEFAADKLTAGAENIITGGFAETAGAVADFSSSANALGFGGDEAMAALVLAENASKSVNIGGTQVRALLGAIDSKGLNKGTLRESVLGIQSQIEGGASAQSILGSIEAIQAYRQISGNIGRFDQLVGGLGEAQGALASRDFISADPTAAAAAQAQASRGRLADVVAGSSERELLFDALVAERQAATGSGFNRAMIGMFNALDDAAGLEDANFRRALQNERDTLSPQLIRSLEVYLERIANGVEAGTTRQE